MDYVQYKIDRHPLTDDQGPYVVGYPVVGTDPLGESELLILVPQAVVDAQDELDEDGDPKRPVWGLGVPTTDVLVLMGEKTMAWEQMRATDPEWSQYTDVGLDLCMDPA